MGETRDNQPDKMNMNAFFLYNDQNILFVFFIGKVPFCGFSNSGVIFLGDGLEQGLGTASFCQGDWSSVSDGKVQNDDRAE